MYKINEEAYRFEEHNFQDGFFEDCVEATFIIHLVDNNRLEHILKQLKEFQPSKKVFILYNKGYNNSKKQDYITRPPLDLVDAFITCFKYAMNNGLNTILILEDDFIFVKKYLTNNNIIDISTYINNNKDKKLIYKLGCFDYKFKFSNEKHLTYKCGGAAHSVIYSKSVMEDTLKINQQEIIDWGDHTWNHLFEKKMFYKPLCIQSIKKTENRKYWHLGKYGRHKSYFLHILECTLSDIFICLLRLDSDYPVFSWDFVYGFFNITNFQYMKELIFN